MGQPDKEKLRQMYCSQQMTLEEMGEELGVVKSTVSRWLENHNIDRRNPGHRPGPVRYRTSIHGYPQWRTKINGQKNQLFVHQLLAVSEYGFEELSGKVVHHKNGIPWDNRPENIEVLFRGEHVDRHRHEWEDRRIKSVTEAMTGESNHSAKITKSEAKEIRRRYDRGQEIETIASDYPISASHVETIGLRNSWSEDGEQN